jgi:hypothetical protein
MLQLPIMSELAASRRVLVAGAGGGFDVFSGLPLYFGLKAAGKEVFLGSLSFSDLAEPIALRLAPAVATVTADQPSRAPYFPELHLARWFQQQGEEVPVYCFERTGVKLLTEAYRALVAHLKIDTVLLVDGGTDSLMRGDECDLGTPHEDISSILAVNALDVPRKLLACLGFGVDYHHGVHHYYFLEAVAELTRSGHYLGLFSLQKEMPEAQKYLAAVAAVRRAMPAFPSIVCSSIVAALEGRYGNHHNNARTAGSELWINPLMPAYWCFQLAGVAERILYQEAMLKTESFREVMHVIDDFRRTAEDVIRPRKHILV